MKKIVCLLISFFIVFSASAITVKIENTSLDLKAKNYAGDPSISASCKLNVDGIKGEKFDLVAIVKDDKGEWHKDENGNVVKKHIECNALYDRNLWNSISVNITHSKLAPKPGKHNYQVYLYVYYKGKWYGGTKVGSYDQTGSSASNGKTYASSGRSSSQKTTSTASSSSEYVTVTCTTCDGTGKIMCLGGCSGLGVIKVLKNTGYPLYNNYYVDRRCDKCNGTGKQNCIVCHGKGTLSYKKNANVNSGGYAGGGYPAGTYNSGGGYSSGSGSRSSSSGRSSAYTTCRICGGSGVCTSCGGTGGSWKETGYYTGTDTRTWINCGSCRGNKRCFNCHGTGRQ